MTVTCSSTSTPATASTASESQTQPDLAATLRRLGPAGVLAAFWFVLPLGGSAILGYYSTSITAYFESCSAWVGVSVFVVGFVLTAGLGLLPTYAQAIIAGIVFGLTDGLIAAVLGFTGAAILGYVVARTVSRNRVHQLIQENPKAAAVKSALVDQPPFKTLAVVSLLRLPPNSPFAMTNLVMAGVRVPVLIFVAGTIIGLTPRTLAAVYIGSQFHGEAPKNESRWMLAIGVVVTVLVIVTIGLIARKALTRLIPPKSDIQPAAGQAVEN